MFCWHTWKVVEKTEQPSAYEQSIAAGQTLRRVEDDIVGSFYRKPIIVTYRCSKCGAEKVERV